MAGIAALEDRARVEWEIAENHKAREFTLNAFKEIGYGTTDSQTNFLWVNVRRPSKEFREVCFERGVLVGRDFPPMENSHSRISLGSMDEMRPDGALRTIVAFRQHCWRHAARRY